ncbi:TonB family protein [Caulobacter soli]|uniref:TonB family protein n=1 Tax=Caulobacter soli TaxID=2708539 RepID=UPI0013EA67BA|nr:TonB family protein [Caulobacter soli]
MIKHLSAVAAAVLVWLGGTAAAQEGTGAPNFILRGDEIFEAYPAGAKAKGLEGEVTISCDGASRISNCALVSETPAGEGFGDAALAIARRYEAAPSSKGPPIYGQPRSITIPFTLPKARTVRAGGVEYVLPLPLEQPSMDALYAAWPRAARFTGTEGAAELWCVVALDGRLKDCTVGKERGRDHGFGAAALSLTPLFRYQPALRAGKPAVMSIPVRVDFVCDSWCRPFENSTVRAERRWLAAPTPQQVMAAYPPAALSRGIEGQVRLNCTVGKTGGLEACATVAESVPGEGFSAAAQQLGPLFHLAAPDPKASPGKVGVVVAFGPSPVVPAWLRGQRYTPVLDAAGAAVQGEARVKCRVAEQGGLEACEVLDPVDPVVRDEVLKRAAGLTAQLWTEEGRSTIGYVLEMRYTLDPSQQVALLGGEPKPPVVAPGVIDYRPLTGLSVPRDIARYYPDRAARMEVNGRVALECAGLVDGRPEGCKVVSESPLDYGFGDAALKLSGQFLGADETIDGASTHEPVPIPINFKTPR